LDVTKTNKKTNPDILWMEKDADCLDFEDKKYKSMVDYFESKIKFPSLPDTYSKDDDYEDILEDKVITHLDNVKDNITKEGVYKKKDKKEAKRTMMRGRRLSKANKTPEMPKDKSWKESDEDPFAVKLFEKTNISARSLKVSKDTKSAATATTANSSVTKNQTKVETPKVKTTTASRSLEKESLEDQAKKTKVNDLFHHNVSSTAQQMNEILMNFVISSVITSYFPAPYGKFHDEFNIPYFSIKLNPKWSYPIQECPSLIVSLYMAYINYERLTSFKCIFFGFYWIHYIHRVIIYPLVRVQRCNPSQLCVS